MKELTGYGIPYISTANWVIIAALFFFLTWISVWVLFGKGTLKNFFITSFTKADGRADEKKLSMFAILCTYLFMLYRGAVTGHWLPEYVFWGLTLLIAVWLGLAYQFLKVKDQIEAERNKLLAKTTEVTITQTEPATPEPKE